MKYLEDAQEILEELKGYRHHLHENPEIGFDLPNTVNFVKEKLLSFGYTEDEIEEPTKGCVVTTLGKGDKTILLRADMDALPIKEESGVPFSSKNEYMHACGHDLHTSILLGVAKLLKRDEANLKGHVKLLFQPAEELLIGGQMVVDAGVLENPKVDTAVALHVNPNLEPGFTIKSGPRLASGNNFRIKISGKGSHGAMPHTGIDPVMVGAQIVTGVQALITRELPLDKSAILTMGRFEAKGAINVIPSEAVIEGTIRTLNIDSQNQLKKRVPEVVKGIAELYRAEAEFEFLSDVPPLVIDEDMYESYIEYLYKYETDDWGVYEVGSSAGSEDFAFIANEVPSFFFGLNMPDPEAETRYNLHNPKVTFDEDKMAYGVAAFCDIATGWLEKNS